MFEPIRQRIRKARRDFLRDRILTNGEILDEWRRDRAFLDYQDFPEECDRLDKLIENREQRHEALLTKFKEA